MSEKAVSRLSAPKLQLCCFPGLLVAVFAFLGISASLYSQQSPKLTINWDKTTVVSKSTPTLQVVVNPPLRPGEPLGVAAYKAIKDLGADYVRYVPSSNSNRPQRRRPHGTSASSTP